MVTSTHKASVCAYAARTLRKRYSEQSFLEDWYPYDCPCSLSYTRKDFHRESSAGGLRQPDHQNGGGERRRGEETPAWKVTRQRSLGLATCKYSHGADMLESSRLSCIKLSQRYRDLYIFNTGLDELVGWIFFWWLSWDLRKHRIFLKTKRKCAIQPWCLASLTLKGISSVVYKILC